MKIAISMKLYDYKQVRIGSYMTLQIKFLYLTYNLVCKSGSRTSNINLLRTSTSILVYYVLLLVILV